MATGANIWMNCSEIACPLSANWAINRYDQNYSLRCGKEFPGSTIETTQNVPNLGDCMNLCAATPGCSAFSWDEACDCSVKTNDSVGMAVDMSTTISGFVTLTALQPKSKDMVCPYPNLSVQKAINGAEFQVICGSDFFGGDYAPQYISNNTYYWPTDGAYNIGWHTDTWDECRDQCATSHPLCRHFAFAPGMMFINCFFKNATNSTPTGFDTTPISSGVLLSDLHLPKPERGCVDGAALTVGGVEFRTSCNDFRLPSSGTWGIITQNHVHSFDVCLERCAARSNNVNAEDACAAAMFDDTLQFGWDNCYFLNASLLDYGLRQHNYTVGYLATLEKNFTAPIGELESTDRNHIAEVVGPTIGGIVLVLIVIFLVLRCRQSKPNRPILKRHKHSKSGDEHPLVQSDSSFEMRSMYASSLDKQSLRSRGAYEIEFTPNVEPLDHDSYFSVRMD